MVNRTIIIISVVMLFCNNVHAMNLLQKPFAYVGKSIEDVDLPLIGKLTNILPFALLATGLKECPGQSIMVLTGLLAYILYHNERVRELFAKYALLGLSRLGIRKTLVDEYDETLFIFDGEDADDAEEEMETEDELLDDNSDSDDNDSFRKQENNIQQRQLKFL